MNQQNYTQNDTPMDDQSQMSGTPFQQNDDQASPIPQQQSISIGGSPEAAPVTIQEAPAESIEYGYEEIQKIEKSVEGGQETIERTPEPEAPINEDPVEPPTPMTPVVMPNKPKGPKFFGYHIPAALTNNLSQVKQNVGKGNPVEARTWVRVLLDRLLRKQAAQEE